MSLKKIYLRTYIYAISATPITWSWYRLSPTCSFQPSSKECPKVFLSLMQPHSAINDCTKCCISSVNLSSAKTMSRVQLAFLPEKCLQCFSTIIFQSCYIIHFSLRLFIFWKFDWLKSFFHISMKEISADSAVSVFLRNNLEPG